MLTDLSLNPRAKFFKIIFILTVFNFFAHPLFVGTGGFELDGGINLKAAFGSAVSTFIIGLPIFGFFLGFGIVALKKRKVSYKADGINMALNSIAILNAFFAVGHLIIIARVITN